MGGRFCLSCADRLADSVIDTVTEKQTNLAPGDWRSRPAEMVPPAPRVPSARARELIHAYAGTQRITLIVGVAFLLGGSLFALIFCQGIGVDLALALAGKHHAGVVESSRVRSDIEINGANPHEIRFRYEYGDKKLSGVSTSTDTSVALQPGSAVDIELVPWKPEWARMQGTTASTFGLWASFVLAFPLVGFVLTVTVVRENQREIRAHRDGVPTEATVVFRGPDTSASSNDEHPFLIRWEFHIAGKRYEGKLSHKEERAIADLGLNGEIVVLYDPNNPKVNTAYVA